MNCSALEGVVGFGIECWSLEVRRWEVGVGRWALRWGSRDRPQSGAGMRSSIHRTQSTQARDGLASISEEEGRCGMGIKLVTSPKEDQSHTTGAALTNNKVTLCTLASFCTFNPHSSTSLLPSTPRRYPAGGVSVAISMRGVEDSSSAKSGQCGRFAQSRKRAGRWGWDGGGGRRRRVRRRREEMNGMWRMSWGRGLV